MLETQDLILSALLLMIAGGVQGFLGFGFGIVAMTGLTLSHDILHASGVVNLTGLLVTGTAVWTLRRRILWGPVGRILPGIVAGVLVGVSALSSLDRTWMVRALGVTIVGISAWNLIAPSLRAPKNRGVDLAVGMLSGILSGAFNTGGPPLVAHVYARPDPPDAVKATVQALFLSSGLSRLPVASAHGLMTAEVWRHAALAAPFVLAGLTVGIALGRRVGADQFRRASWAALGLLGAGLLLTS